MKTAKEWLETLPEPYRSQALENLNVVRCYPQPDYECIDKSSAIENGFSWRLTIEGYDYWLNAFNKAENGEL